ncbi:MAG: DUF4349 domain-containing protein [Anaerolineae bacterium]
MSRQLMFQTKESVLLMSFLLLVLFGFTACGAAGAPPPVANESVGSAVTINTEQASQENVAEEVKVEEKPAGTEESGDGTLPDLSIISVNQVSHPSANRLIIKNAELELLVENSDATINRGLGIVAHYGGYVISNRTWFQDEFKYATLTIGVPVQNFEEMLRQLKELAITVTNETASGEDVTDQFVDFESRLRNSEATAARIREFLAQTQNVQESLEVNRQLAQVEAEIEQIKGQMKYLKDRAAFSTITLQISPQMPTPTPTPSPSPTPTPETWSVNRTFTQATGVTNNIAQNLFQLGVDLVIWTTIVILPFALPIVALTWLGSRFIRRWGILAK